MGKRIGLWPALAAIGMIVVLFAAACGTPDPEIIEVEKQVVVEKEVVKEVPVEVIVKEEVVKEVAVERVVVKEVPVEKIVKEIVEEEVIKTIEVPVERVVEKEVVKEIEVEKVVEKPVIVEVEKIVVQEKIVEVEQPFFSRFGEAPMLATLVRRRELDPVEERLPESPLVIPVKEDIGLYGGTWNMGYKGFADRFHGSLRSVVGLLGIDVTTGKSFPQVAESWSVSEGGRLFTFRLRKGMKWSDGHPFTTEDVRFWWDDVIQNDVLYTSKPAILKVKGELASLEILDKRTFRFRFPQPNGLFEEAVMNSAYGYQPWYPAHYMKQLHPNYRDQTELDKLVSDSGFDDWLGFFNDKIDRTNRLTNPDAPVLWPWIPKNKAGDSLAVFDRNPYFFGVDPDGNQLPYIDRFEAELIESGDVLQLRTIAGEFDMQYRNLSMTTVPLMHENAEKGDFRVVIWPPSGSLSEGFVLNQGYVEDPAIGELLQNLDFRIALSHALDRKKIIELVYLGQAEIQQLVPPSNSPYYPGDEYALKYTEYNPAKANEILDRILPSKNADGFRLLPDGREINLEIAVITLFGNQNMLTAELGAEMWRDVGIKAHHKVYERSVWNARLENNEHQVLVEGIGGLTQPFTVGRAAIMPVTGRTYFAPAIGKYVATGGKEGIAPTGDLLKVAEMDQIASTLTAAERYELGKEAFRINVDNLWTIGVSGTAPVWGIQAVKNYMGNVPGSGELVWFMLHSPEQFYFRR